MKRFSHLTQAVWIIAGLCLLMTLGVYMDSMPEYSKIFKDMNRHLLLPWMVDNVTAQPIICLWLFFLIIAATLLFVNTVCCTSYSFVSRLKQTRDPARILLILIHILLLILLIGHALNFTWGKKFSSERLYSGQETNLGQGYTLKLEKITFNTSPEILLSGKPFRRLSPAEFNTQNNTATLSLFKNGALLMKGEAGYMNPLQRWPYLCLIEEFFLDGQDSSHGIGVKVMVVSNPAAKFMFLVYWLMIGCTLLYALFLGKSSRTADKQRGGLS